MRYLPLFLIASPALAHPGAPGHDAGWFTVGFGLLLIIAAFFIMVRGQ